MVKQSALSSFELHYYKGNIKISSSQFNLHVCHLIPNTKLTVFVYFPSVELSLKTTTLKLKYGYMASPHRKRFEGARFLRKVTESTR